ncbi:MAG TPA: GAF domain-containing protein, partial [Chloroflexi bacterium]|nr:GAF domain-containing protein [Chloroflexota bacterium]
VWETGGAIWGQDFARRPITAETVGSVPVRWGDDFLGVLTVTRDGEDGPGFSASDAKLLDLFASQAAAAILNARQYEGEREGATQMAVVNQVARKVASILELDCLLQEIVNAIRQGFGYPHVAILLLDDPGDHLGHLTIAGDYEGYVSLDYKQRVGDGIIGYAAQKGETVLVNDVIRDARYVMGFDEIVPTQSELSIPIKLLDHVIGVLDVQDAHLNAFDEMDEIALETLADQIAVAINNAQLYAAAQSQAERLAVVNRIARAAGSTLHPDELLETVHYEISTVLDADVFFIATYEEEDESLVFRFLIGDETYTPPFRKPLGEGWASYVVTHKAPLLVRDYDRERYQLPKPEVWGSDGIATSWLGVPMLIGERVIGVVCLQSYRPEVYGEEELLLLSTVADQVAVALENAQLFQAERAQREQAELLAETVTTISSTLDVNRVLTNILEGACYLLNVTAGSIWLLDAESGELVCEQATGPQSDVVRGWRLPPGQGIAGWVARHGRSLIVSDTQDDVRYFQAVDLQTGVPLRSILSTPIQLQDEAIGVLQVADKATDRFSASEKTLVESLASAAAIAIENARLYGQAQRDAVTKSALLREVNHRVKNNLAAIIGLLYAERRRADAEELDVYDVIMQDLANRVQGLATVHNLLSAAEWSNLPLNELAERIIDSALDMLPHGKRVSVDVCPSPVWVTPDQAHNLALVINEIATNTIKYGLRGRDRVHISVQIEEQDNLVTFEFRDDGPGFPEEVLRAGQSSVGFDLIRSIVRENLSGDLSLRSCDGAITTIQFKAGA